MKKLLREQILEFLADLYQIRLHRNDSFCLLFPLPLGTLRLEGFFYHSYATGDDVIRYCT